MKRLLTFLKENAIRFQRNTKERLNAKYVFAWTELMYCFFRFGCGPDDYFRYRFYEKSNLERDKFITFLRSKFLIRKYNHKHKCACFRDKIEFNHHFDKYIKREWINLQDADPEQFECFVKKHGKVLMKPINGGRGRGIFLLTAEELTDPLEILEQHRQYLAEEILVQHKELAKLNASSVNTIRVMTFQSQVIAAAIRIGSAGDVVDNLGANGICGHIDLRTGIIDAPAVDKQSRTYLHHPASGEQIVGFQIPQWDEVLRLAGEVARVIPEVAYVGWDIALLEDGVALIEGNHDPGHDIIQMIAQTGMYERIRELSKATG